MHATRPSHRRRRLSAVLAACVLAVPAAAGTAHAQPLHFAAPAAGAVAAPWPEPGPARGKGLVRPGPAAAASRAAAPPARDRDARDQARDGDALDWAAAGALGAGTAAALAFGVAGLRAASRRPRQPAS